MADQKQLKFLKEQGVEAWNTWRRDENITRPDLRGADFRGVDLRGAALTATALAADHYSNFSVEVPHLRDATIRNAKVSRKTQGLENVSDSQRAGLIFVDEGTEFSADGDEQADDQVPDSDAADDLTTGERRKRGLARARRGVLLINGVGFFLAATDGLQFEDGDEQALAAAFRAAMEALRKEINRKDQQVADLNQIIAALEDKNLALDADLEALRHKAEQAAGLGRRCYETFCLTLAANAAAGVVYGVTEGGKYLIGQFGGEIFELFTGSAGGDAPPAPLPERTTPT